MSTDDTGHTGDASTTTAAGSPAATTPATTPGERVVEAARLYLGTPWRHMGRQKRRGVDCVGLLLCAGQDAGLPGLAAYKTPAYNHTVHASALSAELERFLDPVAGGLADAQTGDVIVIRVADGNPQHVGLWVAGDPPRMIHSASNVGRVVEHRWPVAWSDKVAAVLRWRGAEPQTGASEHG